MATPYTEQYTRTFTSFSGADIVATFNGRVIGELQAIQYSVTREKVPVYTMGSPDPRSFSRGKRGIAGSLVFMQFDRDALIDEMIKANGQEGMRFQTFAANSLLDTNGNVSSNYNEIVGRVLGGYDIKSSGGKLPMSYWDEVMTQLGYDRFVNEEAPIEYSDQIPPFHVTLTFANEYGQKAKLEIHHVEILNEGSGYSIDDVIAAKSCTFIARKINYLRPTK